MKSLLRYTMNIKLFIVMGVTWLLEISATLVEKLEYFWYVSDWFNILQGVLVFFIFVCKSKVYEAIKKRLGITLSICLANDSDSILISLFTTAGIKSKNKKGSTTVSTQLSVTSNGKLGKSASTSTLSTSNTNLNVIRKVG